MDIPSLIVGTDPDTDSKVGGEGTLLLDRQCKQLLGHPDRVVGAGQLPEDVLALGLKLVPHHAKAR